MRFVLLGIVAVVLFYIGLLVYLFVIQRDLQYFPTHRDAAAKGSERFKPWKNQKGEFLGYLHRPAQPAKETVLFFHGNAGEALDREWVAELAPKANVLLAEYPGYGAKAGKPTQKEILKDGEAAFEEAMALKVPVVVVGESLGTGVAAFVAARRSETARLALISPFTSAVDVAQGHYKFIPVVVLMRDRYPVQKYLRKAELPLHIAHGTEDDIVPFAQGKKLYETYGGKQKGFSALAGVGHNDIVPALLKSPSAQGFRAFVAP